MNILISSNDGYVMPTMVMLESLFSSNTGKIDVYMLESDLSDEDSDKIAELVRSQGGSYHRIKVSEDLFEGARTRSYISKETYYRLLACELLPEDIDRILWLDGDIIIRKDISSFYETSFEDNAVIACAYGKAMAGLISDNARKIGMKDPDYYFNAGVMLMDMKRCKDLIGKDKIEALTDKGEKDFLFPGQDLCNLVFDGEVKITDYRFYNCMIHCISDEEDLLYAKENACIVHFPGEAKPWKFSDIHFADEWIEYYRKCFKDAPEPRRMSYFRLKALFDRQRNKQ